MATDRAFRRGPFDALPERPRREHSFLELPVRDVRVESRDFGTAGVAYRELGEGPPLLLVHGLMTTSYSWRYVAAKLAERWRVIAPDLVGCGRSDKPRDARYTGPALARFVADLQRALGIRGCAVVGNSLGGYVTMRLALDDPHAMSRLVCIHAPGLPELRLTALHAAMRVPGARRALVALIRRDPLRWAHRNVHYFDETLKSREEAREYGDPLASEEGAEAFAGWLADALAPRDLEAFLVQLIMRLRHRAAFPVPLQLVYARRDPMVPPKIGDKLAELIPSAELVWLDDASHFAQVDAPEALLEAMTPFLRRGLEPQYP